MSEWFFALRALTYAAFRLEFCHELEQGKLVHPSGAYVNDDWGFPTQQFEEHVIPSKPLAALKNAATEWKKELVKQYQL